MRCHLPLFGVCFVLVFMGLSARGGYSGGGGAPPPQPPPPPLTITITIYPFD